MSVTRRKTDWPFAILAYLCAGLALAGVILPGLPTVPFLLIAAWAASRGSERLRRWLEEHRHLGPALRAWEREGAVPARGKWLAVVLLALSWSLIAWHSTGPTVPVAMALLFTAVAVFVVTRPLPTAPAGD